MHDLLIRNGTVVDGSGREAFVSDVAVADGVITAVSRAGGNGDRTTAGRRVVDADGLLVLPGWVDIHTHYDGQATWDPEMTPSSWHGVTTAVFGNCGVGFAPVAAGTEDYLINLMEGVEDIPGSVLAEGIDFCWESYPEYLDTLEAMPRVMDTAGQLAHGALRFYVMGERGADHAEAPDDSELDRLERLTAEALEAGALGVTTSRTPKHRAADGRLTPSLSARDPELAALARGMRRAGAGVLQVNSDFGDGEFAIMRAAAELAGRPLSALLVQMDAWPDRWRQTLAHIGAANADGVAANGQVGCRPIGVLLGLDATVNPFGNHPAYRRVAHLPTVERAALLRNDAGLRRTLIHDRPDDGYTRWIDYALGRTYEFGDDLDYEPHPDTSVARRAQAAGLSRWELALDLLAAGDGDTLLLYTFENYSGGSLDAVAEMLADPHTICGIGDAGAHVGTICDAAYPTFLLTHWGRDRSRGRRFPLEFLVNKQTRRTALAYGLADRGLLAPGYKADINIVDFDALGLTRPRVVHDLPAGGKRLEQRSVGYRHTFVSGVEVAAEGEFTGERPGRLIRGAQQQP
ncbi:MAG: amidohydrolase family protein [bacterium]|nr:amidohydrolase family protein [bacterium]MXZ30988.1 amidohydrolase family protein [Acidimicrobiia bacterium]MYE66950.1 amidohydrolase family protein [Acidimicrobiia bacterium]MYJ12859.1 amidohydrolase family protein [Acidimicrobiia bacterium]